jgi:meso-butanediol dehydrogenase/(S,S)-butanediol dehydrogenase/diacetyl reductase
MNSSYATAQTDSLKGKVALVTGGAQGIGKAIAQRFREAGARVCILDLDSEAGEDTATALGVDFVQVDLAQPAEIVRARRTFADRFTRLDVLVNNAGIELDKPFVHVEADAWDHLQAVNLRAPFLLTQALLPLFPASGGSIINISSIHATHAFPNSIAYACSKAAMIALTRNLALELADRRIRVNALCPGYIDTRLWDNYLQSSEDAAAIAQQITALHPVGRRGSPADVAEAAVFLASGASAFVNGTQLVVDGGLTVRAHP